MASESPQILRGILVPDPRVTSDALWVSESDYTQAGPEPGVAVPQSDTAMELVVSGSQSSGGALRVRAASAGFPERDGATFVWQQEGDADWRGWDPPSAISGFESVYWPPTSANEARHPHAVALDSGVVLVAVCANDGTNSLVGVQRRTTAGAWSSVSVHSEAAHGSNEAHPVLVVLPSGRVLCMFLVYDADADLGQLRVYASDDDGATWSVYQRFALREAIDTSVYTVERARGAYAAGLGHMVLFFELTKASARQVLAQYASRDLGASFKQVWVQPGDAYAAGTPIPWGSGKNHDVVAMPDNSGFRLVWQPDWSGATSIDVATYTVSLPSAYDQTWSDRAEVSEFGWDKTTHFVLEHTIVAADDGALYIVALGRPYTSGDTPLGMAAVSYDSGKTWARVGLDIAKSADAAWFNTATAGTAHPQRFHGCWHRGRLLLAHNADDAFSGTADPDALWAAYLGGYTTVTLPAVDLFEATTNAVPWYARWHPYEMPTATGWTASGTATSETLNGDLTVVTASATARYYTHARSATVAEGFIAEAEFSTLDAAEIGLRIKLQDGTNSYEADLRLTSTQVYAWDNIANAQVGSTGSVSAGDRVTLRMAVAGGKVFAAFKVDAQDEDRDWTVLANGVVLSDGGAAAVLGEVSMGRMRAVGLGSTFTIYSAGLTRWRGARLAEGFSNPDDLRGRPFSGLPLYVDDGTRIQALTGPCARDDEWDIDVRHQHGIENIHPWESASPRRTWRSTSAPAGMHIAWALSDFDLAQHGLDHGLVALYLDNINFPTARLAYSDQVSSAAWTTVADLDFREEVEFERESNLVVPTTGGSATPGPYIHRNELVGGWFQFASGEVRPIVANTEGHWATGPVGEKRCHLALGDVDDTESTSGTGHIWFPRALVILHDFTDSAAALRLTIRPSAAVPAPPDGYYQAGVVALGNVAVFGRSYGFGHRTRYLPNVEMEELPSGMERLRKRGPRRREVSLRWDDGLITAQTRGSETSDYLSSTSTSTLPVASARDVQWLLEGLDDQLDGPLRPGVLLPFIPAGAPDVVVHLWQRTRGAIYGRIVESPTLENIRGHEQLDELIRTGLVWREVV